jgi:hypothetical protein
MITKLFSSSWNKEKISQKLCHLNIGPNQRLELKFVAAEIIFFSRDALGRVKEERYEQMSNEWLSE